ncbi:MAG: hypothetical protein PHI06_12470 [Desulfobulbaceae bacterium]|nr:hypothetical protein [Desulfobulbaceae bacterium]
MAFQFSEEEIQAVKSRFPKLELVQPMVWAGEVDLLASYNGREIKDQYEIAITVTEKYPNELPCLREIGGRTKAIAEKYNIADLRTLHCNQENGMACLCVKQEEGKRFPPGSSMVKFMDELAVPYLYGLSSYDKDGRWPWKEYSHGSLGPLEYEGEVLTLHSHESIVTLIQYFSKDKKWSKYREQLIEPKGYRRCLCGSVIPFYACHRLAWAGIQRLHDCMLSLGISPKRQILECEDNIND